MNYQYLSEYTNYGDMVERLSEYYSKGWEYIDCVVISSSIYLITLRKKTIEQPPFPYGNPH